MFSTIDCNTQYVNHKMNTTTENFSTETYSAFILQYHEVMPREYVPHHIICGWCCIFDFTGNFSLAVHGLPRIILTHFSAYCSRLRMSLSTRGKI